MLKAAPKGVDRRTSMTENRPMIRLQIKQRPDADAKNRHSSGEGAFAQLLWHSPFNG